MAPAWLSYSFEVEFYGGGSKLMTALWNLLFMVENTFFLKKKSILDVDHF